MTNKHIVLALAAIGAAALLMLLAFGQPYSGTGQTVTVTNPSPTNIVHGYIPQRSLFIGATVVFTNIIISNDYSGMIQVGTNFISFGDLSDWVTIVSSMKRNAEALPSLADHQTYTVNVADGLWTHTNVIDIHRCSEFCTRMRYVENGLTNDFHAAFASFTVKTNSP